jgi:hypothetical protein
VVDGFWETERPLQDMARRSGCYVLAVRSGKSLRPYYVGLTARCFKDEVFNPTNLPKYVRALSGGRLRRPVIFLITHPEQSKVNERFIAELEDFLIQTASGLNPALQNFKGVRRPKWHIHGVTGRHHGRRTPAEKRFRELMGWRKNPPANFAVHRTGTRAARSGR